MCLWENEIKTFPHFYYYIYSVASVVATFAICIVSRFNCSNASLLNRLSAVSFPASWFVVQQLSFNQLFPLRFTHTRSKYSDAKSWFIFFPKTRHAIFPLQMIMNRPFPIKWIFAIVCNCLVTLFRSFRGTYRFQLISYFKQKNDSNKKKYRENWMALFSQANK